MSTSHGDVPDQSEVGGEPIVGVIGGSGLYELLEPGTGETVNVETPYGAPSSQIVLGRFAGRRVAFLTRHGSTHAVPPHAINYRANLWALASIGVAAVVTSSAVGSISPAIAPGTFVIPDQLIDRTSGRADTYFDGGSDNGAFESGVEHVPFADPYCQQLRRVAATSLAALGESFVPDGTTVVVQGPRFSTRAESRWFRSAGADIVNMTQYPEAVLAAELNMGLVNLSFVTDTDAGEASDEATSGEASDAAVSSQQVFERMAAAQPRIRTAIVAIVAAIPLDYEPRRSISPNAVARVLSSASTVRR